MNEDVMETVEYIHSQVEGLNANSNSYGSGYSAQRVGILMGLLVMVTVLCLLVLKRCHNACCDKYADGYGLPEEKESLLASV